MVLRGLRLPAAPRGVHTSTPPNACQSVLDTLAVDYDLDLATVVHSVYLEKARKASALNLYALNLTPQLLLLYDWGVYGDREAQVFYTPAADPAVLARLRVVLGAHLQADQLERQRIQVLRLLYNDLEFSPLLIKIPSLDLTTHYNDNLLPAHETILQHLQQPDEKDILLLYGPPAPAKPAASAASAASPISLSCLFRRI